MNILYFVIGNSINVHMQVNFSIRSFLAQMEEEDRIIVLTDSPNLYQSIPKVIPIAIQNDIITDWKGVHDFFWRIKIKAIEHITQKYPKEHLLYVDGDTCLKGRLKDIRMRLDASCGMMHAFECHPSKTKNGTPTLRMWTHVKGKKYAGITLSQRHCIYNAGMIAIPKQHFNDIIPITLNLCDEMIADNVLPVLVEQYAFSIAFQEIYDTITEGEPFLVHYWHNKYEWCNYISDFFAKSYIKKFSIKDELDIINRTNFHYLQKKLEFKRIVRKHILMQKL